jgi:hypothetical protein
MAITTPGIVIVRVRQTVARAIGRARLAMQPQGKWANLPGHRLELVGTGFDIRLEKRTLCTQLQLVYSAYDPEGNNIAFTPGNLPGLKDLVEQQARAREEFNL